MATTFYFITEKYLKEKTPLGQNIEAKDLLPFIPEAQDIWIQDILGSNFYYYLWDKYQLQMNIYLTGGTTQIMSNEENFLIGKIQPALAYRVASDSLITNLMQYKNKGPQNQAGDYSNAPILTDVQVLKSDWQAKAEFYEQRIKSFLCASGATYPQYQSNNHTDISPSNETTYDVDLVLNNRNRVLGDGNINAWGYGFGYGYGHPWY